MNYCLQKEIWITPENARLSDSNILGSISVFLKARGFSSNQFLFRPLFADGSKRMFWRIITADRQKSFIAMENPPRDLFARRENKAYLIIGQHLFKQGIPVPEILFFDLANGWFILEDLGDTNLQETVLSERNRFVFYQKITEILLKMQLKGLDSFDPSWTCQTERYDAFVMQHYEIEYFQEAFLYGFLGFKKEWPELETAFQHLIAEASLAGTQVFLHRDFQSRNIMILKDRVGILDWQGGRLGPPGYDLASLLIDPYTDLNIEEQNRIHSYYLQLLKSQKPEWVALFEETYPYLAIQRNLQILGAFAFLSRVRGKMHFVAYIPKALKSLQNLLQKQRDPKFSTLKELVDSIEQYQDV